MNEWQSTRKLHRAGYRPSSMLFRMPTTWRTVEAIDDADYRRDALQAASRY